MATSAVVLACRMAVPNPRATHSHSAGAPSTLRYSMFSTSANPVPTAKPIIAASTRNPILRWRTAYKTKIALRHSSMTGAM